ncbi:uncharacterized protein LOC111351717 [Spodoptera litura]|uniref:Uncharacterized protein LOC111351717 n=1 Tax=Spodoptera litura TaxID=69820 RepID=A0A9J7DZC0_SPOLT|nr:uncharacterized protein LOC111351717 [Spodoptera litura]
MSGCGFGTTETNPKMPKMANNILKLFYQNVRGLRTKTQTFNNNLAASNYDIVAITETGLNSSMHDGELIPPGFNVLRCDRMDGRKQGGVLLAVRSRFQLARLPADNVDTALFELVCATVNSRNNNCLFLCCVVYIPPKCDAEQYMHLFRILENICIKYEKVVVIGDFNMPSATLEVNSYFEYMSAFCGFQQVNEIVNINNCKLDLLLTTLLPGDIKVHLADESLVSVDVQHPPLMVTLCFSGHFGGSSSSQTSFDSSQHNDNHSMWNFKKANLCQLYHDLQLMNWDLIYDTQSSNLALNYFYDIVNNCINLCVPRKNASKSYKNKRTYPEWYTSDIIKDIRTKWRHHKLFKITSSLSDYETFSRYRSIVKRKISAAYQEYQHKLQINFKDDPRSFWTFVRTKQMRRNKPKITKDNLVITEEESAECFARYFHSVYSKKRPALDTHAAERAARGGCAGADSARVHIDYLTRRDLCTAFQRLKPKYSVGPDGIPPFVVKDCSSVFLKPLLHIFNLCLSEGRYPDCWKITRVIPVPKGGKGSDIEGYRPVAVLSAFAKIFESILQKRIYSQVGQTFSEAQHGFRVARGTGSNLLSFMSYVTPAVDAGGQVDVAYFDFRKAFDTVNNDILLAKLSKIGFTPHLLKFFASYLGDRRQFVEYAGRRSKPYYTYSGVSQGSNLGPLEFLIMVNDLPEVVRSARCLLFADDLKVFLQVEDSVGCARLQQDLDQVVQWSRDNELYFNVAKCCVMTYTRARSSICYQYQIDGAIMPRVSNVRDLGVHMVTELTFRKHVTDLCSKSFRHLGFILRQGHDFKNIAVLKILYNALVRSHLETCAIIWNPHEDKYIKMLEKIQNKFTRFLYLKLYGIYPFFPLMYPSLFVLGTVGYNTLEVRRDVALVKYIARVLRGLVHHPEVLEMLGLRVPDGYVGARRRPTLLEVPRARTNLLKYAPISRAIRIINSVPEHDLFHNLPRFIEAVQRHIEYHRIE